METKKKRERHSAAFKAKVAIDAIKEKETLQELSSKYKVSALTISKWKAEFLSNSALAFSGEADATKKEEAHEKQGQALPEDNSQRMLNALLPGTVLPIHRHTKTTEVLVLLRGKMEEIFYEEGFESVWDGDSHCMDLCHKRVLRETSRVLLEVGEEVQGLSIPVGQWHGINVLEPTVILECKDGKYEPLGEEDMIEV